MKQIGTRATIVLILVTLSMYQTIQGEDRFTLQGCIVDTFGTSIAGVEISIAPVSGALVRRTTSEARGKFAFSGIASGEYELTVKALGWATEKMSLVVGETDGRYVVLALKAGGEAKPIDFAGHVRDSNGKPVAGATVRLVNAFNASLVHHAVTDASGSYRLYVDLPGQYVLTVACPEYIVDAKSIVVPATQTRPPIQHDVTLKTGTTSDFFK